MSKPAVHIAVFAGDQKPSVFSTALSLRERRMLYAWLSKNPTLDEIVQRAWELAEEVDEDKGRPAR